MERAADTPDDEDQKGKQSWITVPLLSCMMLSPLAYVLSVGPFVWLFEQGYIDKTTYANLSLIYTPLRVLHDHFAPFKWLMDWYISWFH